jgi:hypothetical protein
MRTLAFACFVLFASADFVLLNPDEFKPLFNDVKINATGPTDQGPFNKPAFDWAKVNVPFFDCDDVDLKTAYAFRWRAYFTHIIPTGYPRNPYVISECLSPTIPGRCNWGAPFGTINAAAGHHIREGRWIRDPIFMDSYIRYWAGVGNTFANGSHTGGGKSAYSDWIAHASFARAQVSGDVSLFLQTTQDKQNETVLQKMVDYFEEHEKNDRVDLLNKKMHFVGDYPQCYYKSDGYDAMEGSISGNGCRPSNNAMYYGNALALSKIAAATGDTTAAAEWVKRAASIRQMYLELLWNDKLDFFAVYKDGSPARAGKANATNGLPFGFPNDVCGVPDGHALPMPQPSGLCVNESEAWRCRPQGCPPSSSWHDSYKYVNDSIKCNTTVDVRELLGLGPPWYFEVPEATTASAKYVKSWEQLFDEEGFMARWGPTTAEQRHRCFNMTHSTHECNWAGPSWPYETTRVLTGLSNLLVNYDQHTMNSTHYMQVLRQYAIAHTQSHAANSR